MVPGYFVNWRSGRWIHRYNPEYSRSFPFQCHNSPALPKLNRRQITTSVGFLPHRAMVTHAQLGQLGCSKDQQTQRPEASLAFFSPPPPRLCALFEHLLCTSQSRREVVVRALSPSNYDLIIPLPLRHQDTQPSLWSVSSHTQYLGFLLVLILIDRSRKRRVWNKRECLVIIR